MNPGYTVNNLNELKALTVNDGAAYIVKNIGWFQYKATANDTADDVTVIEPVSGVGRWFICNNVVNIRNEVLNLNSGSNIQINIDNNDVIHLTLTANTAITFTSNLRNGTFYLAITKNSYNINNWDNRIRWINQPFSFSPDQTFFIGIFLTLNNLIYELQEYTY